jgi:hypothetical protein
MQLRISRTSGPGFLVNGTWGCEDVFVHLAAIIRNPLGRVAKTALLTDRSKLPSSKPFQGSSRSIFSSRYKKVGHWSPESTSSPDLSCLRRLSARQVLGQGIFLKCLLTLRHSRLRLRGRGARLFYNGSSLGYP